MALGIEEIIGYVFLFILVGFAIPTIFTLIKKYQSSKQKSILYFLLGYLLFLIAGGFLIIEKLGLIIYMSNPIKMVELIIRLNVIIGMILAGIAVVLINLFAFENVFTEKKLIPIILVASITGFYTSLIIFINVTDYLDILELAPIVLGEITYDSIIYLILIPSAIICGVFAPSVLYYFSAKQWKKNNPAAQRSLWLAIAITIFAFGYLIEIGIIVVVNLGIIAFFGRLFMLISGILLYICFKMPQWFKDLINWTEDMN